MATGRDALRAIRGAALRLGLMAGTFAALGWAWYDLSGGSDFVAGEHGVTILAEVRPAAPRVDPRPAGLTVQPRELAPVVEVTPRVTSLQTRDPLPSRSVRVPDAPAPAADPAPKAAAPLPDAPAPVIVTETPEPENLRDQLGDDFALAITQAILESETPPAEDVAPPDPDAPAPFIAGLGTTLPMGTPLGEGSVAVLLQPEVFAGEPEYREPEYRVVSGTRVNLRGGPATSFEVVAQLFEGDEVEVLEDNGDGWVRLRTFRSDQLGWMSEEFLERRD